MGVELDKSLDAAEARWRSFNLARYSIEERKDCFCFDGGKLIILKER